MIERLSRILFWMALAVCFVMAMIPVTIDTHTSDKTQHIAAFALLTALGLSGYRRMSRIALLAGLAAFGALIELAQALPIVSRDSDILDWAADLVAVLAVIAIAETVRLLTGTGKRA